ncbi:MAG: hypothetical protein ACH346_06835 [Chthoniobacterales bacterium]
MKMKNLTQYIRPEAVRSKASLTVQVSHGFITTKLSIQLLTPTFSFSFTFLGRSLSFL